MRASFENRWADSGWSAHLPYACNARQSHAASPPSIALHLNERFAQLCELAEPPQDDVAAPAAHAINNAPLRPLVALTCRC